MFRISRLADYSVVILQLIAEYDLNGAAPEREAGKLWTAKQISIATGIGQATVMKLLKQLHHAGLVASYRGPSGGYGPVNGIKDVTLVKIIEAVDGPIFATLCARDHHEGCSLTSSCRTKRTWLGINKVLRDVLERFTLADFCGRTSMELTKTIKPQF